MLEEGEIITALNAFASLGKYEDASQYANYAAAKLRVLHNDPAEAAKGFAQLGDFLDSRYLTQLCGIMNCHRYYDGLRFGYVNGLGLGFGVAKSFLQLDILCIAIVQYFVWIPIFNSSRKRRNIFS